jgi:hypothetical protein
MSEQQDGTNQIRWRYVFFGRVSPPHAFLTLPQPFAIEMKHTAGLSGSLTVTMERMQVVAVVETGQEFGELYTLRNIVQDMAATLTDCANLSNANAFEVQLVSVHDVQLNRTLVFDPGVPALAESMPGQSVDITALLGVAWDESCFRRALADFRSAVRYPGQTGFHCGRVIEALAHFFGPMDSKSNIRASRAKLRDALGFSKEIDSKFLRASAEARHGGGPWLTGGERFELLGATREIMYKFVEFIRRKHGDPATASAVRKKPAAENPAG